MLKIKLHSAVDVITNSSTVIYTYSDGCIEPLKNLIDVLGKAVGFTEKADDMFWVESFISEDYVVDMLFDTNDYDEDALQFKNKLENIKGYKEQGDLVIQLYKDIASGVKEMPRWLEDISKESDYDGNYLTTYLYMFPKDKKYEELCFAITNFLYSPTHEATYG